jgi:enoyl-CoA hydratase
MVAFPLPVIAAVNGPTVGLGCSLALFSDVVVMSAAAFLSDPHVSVGLVAADGGVLAWPVLTSLLWAKGYLMTGDRIRLADALRMGWPTGWSRPTRCSRSAGALTDRIAAQPRQAVQDTKRALNIPSQPGRRRDDRLGAGRAGNGDLVARCH